MSRFLFIFILVTVGLKAQLQKGMTLGGTDVRYWQNSTGRNSPSQATKSKVSDFYIWLRGGYFITEKIVAGALLGYNNIVTNATSAQINVSTLTKTTNYYSAGLFIRSYKILKGSAFAAFCQADVRYFWGNYVEKIGRSSTGIAINTPDTRGNSTGVSARISPGITYFLKKRIGIELSPGSIEYLTQTSSDYVGNTKIQDYNNQGLNINFNLSTLYLGLSFYFGRSPTLIKE
jgi:hypothetical protein